MKGTKFVPFFISLMIANTAQQTIEEMVHSILKSNPDYFLVDIKVKPGNNVLIVLDSDSGVSIDKCVEYNRSLYKMIEGSRLFPNGDFALEVSSSGTDEPLKLRRQYKKNIGRNVEVILRDGIRKEGKLMEVTEYGIVIEERSGKYQHGRQSKKTEVSSHSFLFDNIKSTKVQVAF